MSGRHSDNDSDHSDGDEEFSEDYEERHKKVRASDDYDDGSNNEIEFEEENEISSEDDEDGDEEDEAGNLRKELADIPLGEIQKLKESVGLKKYNEAVFGSYKKKDSSIVESVKVDLNHSHNKRKSDTNALSKKMKVKKSEPEEKSSKVRKSQPRKVVEQSRRIKRDPRFDDLSGKYNEALFEKSYNFLNDIRKEEYNSVKKQLKKTKSVERKADLHKLLKRMEQQNTQRENAQKRKEKDHARKAIETDLVKRGKKVFYLKNSDKKKIELVEKYKALKETGDLDKYMSKKRKRNATKEKRTLPFQI